VPILVVNIMLSLEGVGGGGGSILYFFPFIYLPAAQGIG